MVGNVKQGYAVLAAMGIIWLGFTALMMWTEFAHARARALQAAGGADGGQGDSASASAASSIFARGHHPDLHRRGQLLPRLLHRPFGGGIALLGMMLGEIAPGGVGSGLYGMLVMAIIAVFIAGLMVGRTPEYLGKKIGTREIKLAACYILVTPALVLALHRRLAMVLPDAHGLDAQHQAPGARTASPRCCTPSPPAPTTTAPRSPASTPTRPWYNTTLGLAMLLGRFLPMVFVLALAGSLAEQKPVPATAGTLRTDKPLFAGLLVGTILIITGLTYFPALALGPARGRAA